MSRTRRKRTNMKWRPCGRCSAPFARHEAKPPHGIDGRCAGYLVHV